MNLFLSVFPSLFLFAAFPAGKNGKKTRVRVRQRAADCVPRRLGKSFLCDASPAMSSSFPDAGGLGCSVLFLWVRLPSGQGRMTQDGSLYFLLSARRISGGGFSWGLSINF